MIPISLSVGEPAQALSCVVFPVELEYLSAAESDRQYYIVLGEFEPNGSEPTVTIVPKPEVFTSQAGSYCTWNGSIVGRALGRVDFVTPIELAATLTYSYSDDRAECVTPRLRPIIVFHAVDETGPQRLLNHGGCENNIIYSDEDTLRRILSCHNGSGCNGYE